MEEKKNHYLLTTVQDDSTKTKEAAIKVALAEAKEQAKHDKDIPSNLRVRATRLMESKKGNVWQIVAEAFDDEEFPTDVEDVVDTPADDIIDDVESLDEEEEDVESKVEELESKLEALEDKVDELSGEESEIEEEVEDFEDDVPFDDPDLGVEDDDKFFSSRRRTPRRPTRRPARRPVARRRTAAPKRDTIVLEAPRVGTDGKKVSRLDAKRDAERLARTNKALRGMKLASVGEDKDRDVYVAQYVRG